MMFEKTLLCFSVFRAPLSTYPLLRIIDKGTSTHPHILIRFSLVSMVNNRSEGLGRREAGRTMHEHLCSLHKLFENLFCLGIKNLWQLWSSYNSFSATVRWKSQIAWNCIWSNRIQENFWRQLLWKHLNTFYDILWNRTWRKLGKIRLGLWAAKSLICHGLPSPNLPVPVKMLLWEV